MHATQLTTYTYFKFIHFKKPFFQMSEVIFYFLSSPVKTNLSHKQFPQREMIPFSNFVLCGPKYLRHNLSRQSQKVSKERRRRYNSLRLMMTIGQRLDEGNVMDRWKSIGRISSTFFRGNFVRPRIKFPMKNIGAPLRVHVRKVTFICQNEPLDLRGFISKT